MPPKKSKSSKKCHCGTCDDTSPHLPGLLLAAFGLLALPLNFGLIPALEWAKAWPLLLVLFGAVLVVKVGICKSRS